jgi:hypothetical protein
MMLGWRPIFLIVFSCSRKRETSILVCAMGSVASLTVLESLMVSLTASLSASSVSSSAWSADDLHLDQSRNHTMTRNSACVSSYLCTSVARGCFQQESCPQS